jgi:hypothetical protein
MVDETGVRFGLANGALVLALLVAAALPLDLSQTAAIAVVTAGVASAPLPRRLSFVLGLVAWAWFTGFFENRYGVLTFTSSDLLDLVGFVAATAVLAQFLRTPFSASAGVGRE